MKLYKLIKSILKNNPRIFMMFLALGCAIGMWWLISKKDRIEATIDLHLDFSNIPENIIVTDGLTNKVSVRLRGPERLLRTVPREAQHKNINLSTIKSGENVVSVKQSIDDLPEFRAFEVISFNPPTITVHADRIVEKEVGISVEVESPLGEGALEIGNVNVIPASVTIKGPEKTVDGIKKLSYTIQGDANAKEDAVISTPLVLKTPPLVTPSRTEVEVRYKVVSSRALLSIKCPVLIIGNQNNDYETEPKELDLRVDVPAALKASKDYLDKIYIYVDPPEIMVGQSMRIRVKSNLPDGANWVTPPDREVTLIKRHN